MGEVCTSFSLAAHFINIIMQCTYAPACYHITVYIPPGDTVTPRKGRKVTLRIVQRFHFSSALKRMSAVCSLVQASQQGPALLATAKGAPEVLKEMVSRGGGGGGGGGRHRLV